MSQGRWELSTAAQQIGLKANVTKTKHMRMNSRTNEPIKLQGENSEEVEEFTYLGSRMIAEEREMHAWLSKAGQAFYYTQKHLEIWENFSEKKNTPFSRPMFLVSSFMDQNPGK